MCRPTAPRREGRRAHRGTSSVARAQALVRLDQRSLLRHTAATSTGSTRARTARALVRRTSCSCASRLYDTSALRHGGLSVYKWPLLQLHARKPARAGRKRRRVNASCESSTVRKHYCVLCHLLVLQNEKEGPTTSNCCCLSRATCAACCVSTSATSGTTRSHTCERRDDKCVRRRRSCIGDFVDFSINFMGMYVCPSLRSRHRHVE